MQPIINIQISSTSRMVDCLNIVTVSPACYFIGWKEVSQWELCNFLLKCHAPLQFSSDWCGRHIGPYYGSVNKSVMQCMTVLMHCISVQQCLSVYSFVAKDILEAFSISKSPFFLLSEPFKKGHCTGETSAETCCLILYVINNDNQIFYQNAQSFLDGIQSMNDAQLV